MIQHWIAWTALSSSKFKRIYFRTQRDRQKARDERRKRESLDATRSIRQSKAALIDFFLWALKCEGMHTRAQIQGRISQNLKCPPNPLNPTPTALRKSRKTLKRRVSGNTVSTPVPVSIQTRCGIKSVLLCPSDPELLSCLSSGFKESSESFIAKWASPQYSGRWLCLTGPLRTDRPINTVREQERKEMCS